MNKKAIILHIAKRLWLIVAFCIVLLAVISTAVRLGTPWFGRYRLQMQAFASKLLQHPVTIQNVKASWYWFEPVVRFSDVEILDKQQSQRPLLRVQHLAIGIDLLASLLHRHLLPGLLIASGANITIHEDQQDHLKIDGINRFHTDLMQNNSGQDPRGILQWLFTQERITLQNINIQYIGKNNHVIPISNLNIVLENQDITHIIEGSAKLAQTIATQLAFNGTFLGGMSDLKNWRGKLYISANNITIPQWSRFDSVHNITATSGEMDIKLWTIWENSRLTKIQSLLKINDLNLHNASNNADRLIQQFNANLAWEKQAQGFQLNGDNIELKISGKDWQTNQFSFNYSASQSGQNNWQLYIDYFRPHDFFNLIDDSMLKNKRAGDLIKKINPYVELGKFYFNKQDNNWVINSRFHDLQWQENKRIPGISGLSGQLLLRDNFMQVLLDSDKLTYTGHDLFATPLTFNQFSADLQWQKQASDQSWQLNSKQIKLANADVQLMAQLHIQKNSKQKLPLVNINASYTIPNAVAAKKYLPINIMKYKLKHWLLTSIQGGQAEGTFILRGALDNFPFKENQGLFLVDSQLHNVKLDYHPGWPLATDINGHLTFRNDSMQASVYNGKIDSIPVDNINVSIPVLGHDKDILNITGTVKTDMRKGMHYLLNSPLINKLKSLQTMQLSGPMELALQLAITLYPGGADHVNGQIKMNNDKLFLINWKLMLNNITGVLSFSEKGIDAKNLQSKLFNQATNLSIATVAATKTNAKHMRIDLDGIVDIDSLRNYFSMPAISFIKGSSNYQANIIIPSNDDENQLHLHSQLQGIAITAIAPLAKQAQQKTPLILTARFANKIPRGKPQVTEKTNQNDSFAIKYNNDVQIDIQQQPDKWQVNVNSDQVKGKINVFRGSPMKIQANLDKLYLHKITEKTEKKLSDIDNIPSLDLTITDFYYDTIHLDELIVNSSTEKNLIRINKIQTKTKNVFLSAKGEWRKDKGNKISTYLNGEITTNNLAQALQDLHVSPAIDSDNGRLTFSVLWPGSPDDFSLAKLDGTVDIDLRHGRITHLTKQAKEKVGVGKVLSLFSLQTLPRRLSLDFSDLSQGGLSFDVFKGHFTIANGIANTTNTALNGTVADVSATGNVNMAKKEYNLSLKVTPHITSSLPIVATIAGGPIAGAVTWLAGKILSPEMMQATSYPYEITGPWKQPVVKQVKTTGTNK